MDAAIGVFKGIPLGLTNVGGVDVLVDASYVPTVSGSSIDVKPNQNLQLGFGVRAPEEGQVADKKENDAG